MPEANRLAARGAPHGAPRGREVDLLHYGVLRGRRFAGAAVSAKRFGVPTGEGSQHRGCRDTRAGGSAPAGVSASGYQVAERAGEARGRAGSSCWLMQVIKLADFGLSKKKQNVTGTVLGTSEYMSPELLRGHRYGFEVDMWGLGVLFYFMLNAEPPFSRGLLI